jgi:hypothetical protein
MSSTPFNPDTSRFYYLNSDGSRGVRIDSDGNRERLPVSLDGKTTRPRAVLYWQTLGNFAVPYIRVQGKAVAVYPDSEVTPSAWLPFEVLYPSAAK